MAHPKAARRSAEDVIETRREQPQRGWFWLVLKARAPSDAYTARPRTAQKDASQCSENTHPTVSTRELSGGRVFSSVRPVFSLLSHCYLNTTKALKDGKCVWGRRTHARPGRRSRAHQDFPELFLSPRLLLEQLLEQGAQGPALLRDHLLQHKSRPSATGSARLWRPVSPGGGRIPPPRPPTYFQARQRGPHGGPNPIR